MMAQRVLLLCATVVLAVAAMASANSLWWEGGVPVRLQRVAHSGANASALVTDALAAAVDGGLVPFLIESTTDKVEWVVGAAAMDGFDSPAIHVGAAWPADWVQQQARDGRRITAAAYHHRTGLWTVAVARTSKWTDQTVQRVTVLTRENLVAHGLPTVVAHGNGEWIIVSSPTHRQVHGIVSHSIEFPAAELEQFLAAHPGAHVSVVSFANNQWVVGLGVDPKHKLHQQFYVSNEFPTALLHAKWPKHHSSEGAGMWLTALSSSAAGFVSVFSTSVGLPVSFNSMTQWPHIGTILNQGSCGSCWAFSTAGSTYDRLVVVGETGGQTQTLVSPQPIVSCDQNGVAGCNGGALASAFYFLGTAGGTTCTNLCANGCAPYISGGCTEGQDNGHDGCHACPGAVCSDGSGWSQVYKIASYHQVVGADAMGQDIMTNGPLSTCFTIYSNFNPFFQSNPGGIYGSTAGASALGGHCIRIMGWSYDGNVPFWYIANSWGYGWADSGYFRMVATINLCGLEQGAVSGSPAGVMAAAMDASWDQSVDRASSKSRAHVSTRDTPLEAAQPLFGAVYNATHGGRWQAVDPADVHIMPSVRTALAAYHASPLHISNVQTQVVNGVMFQVDAVEISTGRPVSARVLQSVSGTMQVLSFKFV